MEVSGCIVGLTVGDVVVGCSVVGESVLIGNCISISIVQDTSRGQVHPAGTTPSSLHLPLIAPNSIINRVFSVGQSYSLTGIPNLHSM